MSGGVNTEDKQFNQQAVKGYAEGIVALSKLVLSFMPDEYGVGCVRTKFQSFNDDRGQKEERL